MRRRQSLGMPNETRGKASYCHPAAYVYVVCISDVRLWSGKVVGSVELEVVEALVRRRTSSREMDLEFGLTYFLTTPHTAWIELLLNQS